MSMSMWQRTEEMARRHEQNSQLWLKLPHDGDRAVVVILGEPHPREVCFVDGRFVQMTEALKSQGQKPSLRIGFNVALYDSKEVRVLEQGVTFFKDLVQVRTKYGLDKWAFEIRRHGASKDLKTHYSILPEKQLSAEELRVFTALPLHDLERLYAAEAEESSPVAKAPHLAVVKAPSDDRVQKIVDVLKPLPPAAAERFSKTFGIARIRDIPPEKLETAMLFAHALQQEFTPRAAAIHQPEYDEVDPFG